MTREPAFVLAGRTGAVVADGVHTAFPGSADARAALASHSAPIILGALPFDVSKPAALMRPQSVQFTETLPDWPLRELPDRADRADDSRARRAPRTHRRGAAPAAGPGRAACTRWCWRGRCGWSPTARWTSAPSCIGCVADDAAANAYLVDLTAAGGGYSGTALVGASPELLVARRGDR